MERTGEFFSAFCFCFLKPVLEVVTSQKQLHRAGLNGSNVIHQAYVCPFGSKKLAFQHK